MTANDRRAASNTSATSAGSTLRRRAEARLRDGAAPPADELGALAPPEETLRLLHELRVHQIELEMQNDELRRAQVELDAERVRYFDLYDMAPAGYCTMSQQGVILEANFAAATLLGLARGALVNKPITRFILKADQDLYYHLNKRLTESGGRQACELRMVKNDGTPCRVHLVASVAHGADDAPHLRIVLVDVPEPERA